MCSWNAFKKSKCIQTVKKGDLKKKAIGEWEGIYFMLNGVWHYKVFSCWLNTGVENDCIMCPEWGEHANWYYWNTN